MKTKTVGDLEIEEDLHEQRITWLVERIGWCAMAFVCSAALAGAFGGGRYARERTADGMAVEFQRTARKHAPTELRFTLPPDGSEDTVRIERDYLEGFRIELITPEPEETAIEGPWLRYRFEALEGGGRVIFRLEPEHAGRHKGRVAASPESALELKQFVFP